ncbi:translocation protein Y [Vibrio azureus]|nr:translocation protein Y [Vibrio azureus]
MLSPKDQELLLVHAALQVQYQKPEQAITLLEGLLEFEPEHKEAQQVLAVASLHAGQYERSAELCEQLIQAQSINQSGLWFCLSQARWKQQNNKEARYAHRRYLQSLNSESNE